MILRKPLIIAHSVGCWPNNRAVPSVAKKRERMLRATVVLSGGKYDEVRSRKCLVSWRMWAYRINHNDNDTGKFFISMLRGRYGPAVPFHSTDVAKVSNASGRVCCYIIQKGEFLFQWKMRKNFFSSGVWKIIPNLSVKPVKAYNNYLRVNMDDWMW